MDNETSLRKYWAPKLWKSKGFDSEAEFMEPGRCFACGLEGESLTLRNYSTDEPGHLLCELCTADSDGLTQDEYTDWFYARSAPDTVAAYMTRKVARMGSLQPR